MQDSEKLQEPRAGQAEGGPLHEDELRARVEALRGVGVFSDMPEDQLSWFAENSTERHLAAGEIIFKSGDKAEWMAVYLEGESHVLRDENVLDDYVYIIRAGDPLTEVSGMLPYSRMTEFTVTIRAVVPTRVLLFPITLFPEMLQRMPSLGQRLVGVMSDRVREGTRLNVQRDKLMALGKLSAGLAHELNNPAAAAQRAADEMIAALDELRAADLRLCRQNLSANQRTLITDFEHRAIAWQDDALLLGALEQSDLEDSLASWLEGQDVEEGWKVASFLVEGGIDIASLERVTSEVGKEALGDLLSRVAAQLRVARLVKDIKAGTTRIAELVGAIKEYSYMDQASRQEVDLHKGLDNTLLILKHKLKSKNITVVRDYSKDLPSIKAFGSELNQVWTNLIDNAIDAMPEGGRLKVRTKLEPVNVMIEVRDNGPGIPSEAQAHIFEPFFTTKPVGAGTGLGLDTSMKIVRKHHGNLRFETKPGDTCFQVRLPLNMSA
ncbi:MAG: ATP-binding protein [Pyrinomonadaceae bacterium]